jgi:hypothetical protein
MAVIRTRTPAADPTLLALPNQFRDQWRADDTLEMGGVCGYGSGGVHPPHHVLRQP